MQDTIVTDPSSEYFGPAVSWLEDRGVETFGVAALVIEPVSEHLCRFHLVRNAEGEVPFESIDLGLAETRRIPQYLRGVA